MAKRIAVFADGTGNSAAKLFKTNVWRMYDALDTGDPGTSGRMRQIAYYHDGVGTSSFKPLAVLGGAFGWGLKRNILDLYTFVCRNYEPGGTIRCWPLHQTVEAGLSYRVKVTVGQPWVDRTIDTNVPGFGPSRMGFLGSLMAPLRRSLSAQWFQPMLKIRAPGGWFAVVPLDMKRADVPVPQYAGQFLAPRSGCAYFFVNDVLLPSWVRPAHEFYENNRGSATIEIERVVPPEEGPTPPPGRC